MSAEVGGPTVLGEALRQARAFDRAKFSARAGIVAALPVAAMMALGMALGSPTDAVTLGVGAMLVGIAWRAGDGPATPPLATMAAATTVLPLCTLAGTLTGRWPWLHLGVLCLICLAAGLATALGRRGVSPGTQAVIAFVVFGRFPEGLANAAGLAGLVLAGGVAQTAFAALVGRPAAWRRQRAAIADAYLKLDQLAGQLDGSAAASARSLEEAADLLAAPALFADPERSALIGLVGEGRRIRLELAALSSALSQARRERPQQGSGAPVPSEALSPAEVPPPAEVPRSAEVPPPAEALARLRAVLREIVAVLQGSRGAAERLLPAAGELGEWGAQRAQAPGSRVDQRLGALVGQVCAAARMAATIDQPQVRLLVVGRPTLGSRGALARLAYRLRTDYRQMRAHASLRAAAGRHAVRLAAVVAGTELLTQRVALPRGYWAVVAAATVLRPGFGATFTRGAERVLGTCLGVLIASLIAVALNPGGWWLVLVVGLLSYCSYAVFPASFALGTAMFTAVLVFLLHAIIGDTLATALDRGIDTIIGGGIGLAAYALWPTWSALAAGPLLADLVDAQHRYLEDVLSNLVNGTRSATAAVRAHARRARVSFTDAEALVTLAQGEPRRGELDPAAAAAALNALRRVVYAIHALRLELAAAPSGAAHPELGELADGFRAALGALAAQLREGERARGFPPLRRLFREVMWEREEQSLRSVFDELVDALDSAADAAGIDLR